MHDGFDTRDDIDGLVGQEIGAKLSAFLNVRVDLNGLLKNPEMFKELSVDAQYMATLMLGTYVTQNMSKFSRGKSKKKLNEVLHLIDSMVEKSREFLILMCTTLNSTNLRKFLRTLVEYNPEYKDWLVEITLNLKSALSV
jgi:hypothetical protein